MIVLFITEQLRTDCVSLERLVKQYGEKKARRIRQRLDELDAVQNLAQVKSLPAANCRSIDNRAGVIAVDTIPPACILLQAVNLNSGTGWHQVTTVQIIKLNENIHDL